MTKTENSVKLTNNAVTRRHSQIINCRCFYRAIACATIITVHLSVNHPFNDQTYFPHADRVPIESLTS